MLCTHICLSAPCIVRLFPKEYFHYFHYISGNNAFPNPMFLFFISHLLFVHWIVITVPSTHKHGAIINVNRMEQNRMFLCFVHRMKVNRIHCCLTFSLQMKITTCGWLNDDRIFIFAVNYPSEQTLRTPYQTGAFPPRRQGRQCLLKKKIWEKKCIIQK